MALLIPITGIDANFRVPGGYAEVLFAQGPASAAAGVREVVFAMPMITGGTYTANTLNRVNNEAETSAGGGAGSPLHRGTRKFLSINKDAKVWVVPVAPTTGGSPVAATGTVTFATNSTGIGTATVTIVGEECTFTFASGATPTTIAAGIVASINAKSWLPVTAANAAGVVTLTAKLAGTSQGTATVAVIRYRATITAGVGTTVATSGAHLGTGVAGADGSTTEAAQLATALATLDAIRKYYVVISEPDATSWGHLKTHLTTKSQPKRGLRSVGICAYVHGQSTAQTQAVTLNYERVSAVQQTNSEHDCAELAGAWAAFRQMGEQLDSAYNFDGTRLSPHIKPAFAVSDWPTADNQNDAINDGVTCIASDNSGAYVVMSVNTRSKNAAGTQADFRATETHRVSVADDYTDQLLILWANQYQGMKAADDQRLSDGTINPTQKFIRGVLKPSQLRAPIAKLMQDFEDAGKLQNTEATKASIQVVKTGGRFECGFELNAIDHAHQATFRIAEVSQG